MLVFYQNLLTVRKGLWLVQTKLFSSEYRTEICFLLKKNSLQLAFFGLRQPQMTVYFIAYDQYFEQELPKLHHHFDVLDVRPDMYLIEW